MSIILMEVLFVKGFFLIRNAIPLYFWLRFVSGNFFTINTRKFDTQSGQQNLVPENFMRQKGTKKFVHVVYCIANLHML